MPNRNRYLAPPAADIDRCRSMLANGSRSFHAASILLPAAMRPAAIALYAWCRQADDAIDLAPAEQRSRAVDLLLRRLEALYAGDVLDTPAERAFAWTVRAHSIPQDLPHALIEGFVWDAEVRRYPDIQALHAYGARVAGSVGAMMSLVMGARDAEALARACDLGVAMQLTNIARDVGEDARMGRVYLPLDWCAAEGIDTEAWLRAPTFSPALGRVVARLLADAEQLYIRATPGIALLPRTVRPAMHAARLLYAEIGREVERRGLDSVSGRAVVPTARKLRLLGNALMDAWDGVPADARAPLEATRHLVEAAMRGLPDTIPAVEFENRLHWLVDLFTRLEREEQAMLAGKVG